MIRQRNLDPSLVAWIMSLGLGPGVGEIHFCVGSTTNYYEWLKTDLKIDPAYIHFNVPDGYAALTADRNDVLVLYPGTNTITADIAWSKSNTHMVGAHSASPWSNSVKISSAAATALVGMTLSGSDCLMKNIHWIDGGTHGDQHNFIKVTGSGNHFDMNWFEGPTNATQGTDTDYRGVILDGGGNYITKSHFGTTAHNTMNGAAQLGWTGSCYRSTIEDCIFYMSSAAVTGRFLNGGVSASDISGPQFFKNCIFSVWYSGGGDRITEVLYNNNKSGTGQYIFDANCIFINADAISSDGKAFIWSGHPLTADHDGTKAGIVENTGGVRP